MNRRDFLALAGAAVAFPRVALAQQAAMRLVGVLMAITSNDSEAGPRQAAFAKGLAEEGLTAGGNVEVVYRWAGDDQQLTATYARQLNDLHPNVLVAHASPATLGLSSLTKTTPIVFGLVADPVGSGIVPSLGSPTGNVTGYVTFDASVVSNWVELLREIDPQLSRVMMLFDPDTAPGAGDFYMQPLIGAAAGMGVETVGSPVRTDAEIEAAVAGFAGPHRAIVGPPDVFVTTHRAAIIQSAAVHQLPAVYPYRYFADEGGLMSYGIDTTDMFRLMGEYVGQILNGTKVSDLPIRAPSNFEFVVNLKTAKALGITVPQTVLARADAVIE